MQSYSNCTFSIIYFCELILKGNTTAEDGALIMNKDPLGLGLNQIDFQLSVSF